jgi:ABC-type transport system substrate-binding protein
MRSDKKSKNAKTGVPRSIEKRGEGVQHVAFVVDEANVKSGKEWWRKPNGTGPFKLKGWEDGELLLLERNELYYRDKAKVSYIAFRLSGAPMQMYETGEIDATYVYLLDLERVTDETNPLYQELKILPKMGQHRRGSGNGHRIKSTINSILQYSQRVDVLANWNGMR